MSDQHSLDSIDGLLCQSALQTRELSQKKNEFIQRIKVCRADIAERRSHIDTLHRNIQKLEEEARGKQSSAMLNKANARSMKATNSLLLQFEQTLKDEIESRNESLNRDTEVYEERIASYTQKFQSHQEYYLKNPMAQKLLRQQAEKEEIECRIKACDDQITMKQAELDHLTGPAVTASSTEKLLDSVTGQQPEEEAEKQLDPQTEDCDSAINSFCLHLNQTKMLQNGDTVSVEAGAADIPEEHKVQNSTICSTYPEEAGRELWSHQQLDEQSWTEEMQTNEQEKDSELQDQVLEQQSNMSEEEEAVEDKAEEGVGTDEEQTSSEKDNEELVAFPQTSCEETNSQASLAKTTAAPSTAAFPFNLSPASGTSDTKSPAFLFSLNSDPPSTPGFSGFGFDSSQADDTNFAFPGSFFNEKKTTDTKSSSGGEFLFDQSEQGEDFPFAFNFKSPQATPKEKSREDFPFSFNF